MVKGWKRLIIKEELYSTLEKRWKQDSEAQRQGVKFSPWIARVLEAGLSKSEAIKASQLVEMVGTEAGLAMRDYKSDLFSFVKVRKDGTVYRAYCEQDRSESCIHAKAAALLAMVTELPKMVESLKT